MPRACRLQSRPVLFAAFALFVMPACIEAPRRPLDPTAIERQLRARSLADPELRDRCVERLGVAAEPWPAVSLDLALLTLAAWRFRPELEVARAEVAAATAKVESARALPNPRLSVQPGRALDAGRSPWFLAAALDFVVPTAGKREKQEAIAAQEVELALLATAESAWQIYTEVRDALLEATLAARELDLARRESELRATFATQQEARVQAGAAGGPERLTAILEADRARAAVARGSAGLALARARLAAACGLATAELDGTTLTPPLLSTDAADGAANGTANGNVASDFTLLDRIDLRRGLAEYEAAERALELEIAKQYPDLQLGPGWEYDQGDRKFLFGIGVELPLFQHNEGPIAEALAQRAAVAARFREREAAALGALDVARAELEATTTRLAAFDADAHARAQSRRDAAARAFAAGATDRSSLTVVELELLSFEAARFAAERARLEAQAHLEDALQRPLDPKLAALEAGGPGT